MNYYREVFTALINSKLKFMVVGGVAVNAYGYRRFTGDLDIILALDLDNLAVMEKIMKDLGYVERLPISLKDLNNQEKLQKYINEKGLLAYTFIGNTGPKLDLDIIVSESMHFSDYLANHKILNIWDLDIPVIGIDDLIGMKKKAGRERDLEDLEALLNIKEL